MPDTTQPTSGPVVTSANVPQPPTATPTPQKAQAPQVPEIDLGEMDDTLIARPLVLPNFVDVRPKNPNVRLRWINRDAPEGRGIRYAQCVAQGFIPAEPGDVIGAAPSFFRDNRVINGDLILMKLDRKTYDGALKYNRDRALRLGSKAVASQDAEKLARETVKDGTRAEAASQVAKISVFTPSEKEIGAMTGADRDKELK